MRCEAVVEKRDSTSSSMPPSGRSRLGQRKYRWPLRQRQAQIYHRSSSSVAPWPSLVIDYSNFRANSNSHAEAIVSPYSSVAITKKLLPCCCSVRRSGSAQGVLSGQGRRHLSAALDVALLGQRMARERRGVFGLLQSNAASLVTLNGRPTTSATGG